MSDLFKAISAISLKAGQVVATQFDGTIALCAASVTPVGVACSAAPIGTITDIETDGVLKLDDWNIATGFRDLSPGSTYYISNSQSGFLTTTKPTTVGQFITRIGVAVTRRALLIKLELPFEIQAIGGGSTPTGTGFRHVVTGVEDAAAKLVENADVHSSAAIVESKLSLGFPTHSNALDHSNASDPSAGEKSALAGTNGTPGAGNKYVTNSDPRNTDARTPAAHTHPISEVTSLQSSLDGKSDLTHTHAGLPVMARISTADATQNSNVTFTTLFTRAILASEVWSFEAILYWFSAAGTTGIVTQVDAPAAPTFSQLVFVTGESATAWRSLTGTVGTTMIGTASAVAVIIASYLSGTIENGANNGNLVVKFRSEVNASLVTVKRGSWCRFYKH